MATDLTIVPLTPDRWPVLEDLFDTTGPVGRCWCMYWRIGASYRSNPVFANRDAFEAVVEGGPPPGILACAGGVAVGWCQITPRGDLPWLERSRRLEPGSAGVWSISCFYIRKGQRRQGVAAALVEGAIERARAGGAAVLEAYPLDRNLTPSASSTGFVSMFERFGFVAVSGTTPARPVMRLAL